MSMRLSPMLLALALSCPVAAGAQVRALASGGGAAVESCVSSQALHIGRDDARAVLDAPDHQAVAAQMLARYPMLARDGFAPSHIVLWQREGRDWLYVTLLENPAGPGEVCFTATFTASALAITPQLLGKYFALRSVRAMPATVTG